MSELAGVIERVRGLVKDEPEVLAYHSIGSVELLSLCAAAERGAQLEAELAAARAIIQRCEDCFGQLPHSIQKMLREPQP